MRSLATLQPDEARSVEHFARALVGAQQISALYPPDHPRVAHAMRELYLRLSAQLERRREVRLALAEGTLVFNDASVRVQGNDLLASLAGLLRRQGAERVVVRAGLRRWEIAAFVEALNTPVEEGPQVSSIDRLLAERGVQHISAGPLVVDDEEPQAEPDQGDGLPEAWALYDRTSREVARLRQEIAHTVSTAAVRRATQIARELVHAVRRQPDVFLLLYGLKRHDAYSFAHSVDVAILSLTIARGLGFNGAQLHRTGLAALLHDVGKELVPREILNKPGRLTDEEWEVMQRHGPEGARLLLRAPNTPPLAVVVAYEHHLAEEADDPDAGRWRLHLVSQIVSIADVYDALRSHRPYRAALPPDEAMRIMDQEASGRFDPHLLEGFRRFMGYYPPGTCLRLQDGRLAISCRSNTRAPDRPQVLVVREADGADCPVPYTLDLAEEASCSVAEVVAAEAHDLDPLDYF